VAVVLTSCGRPDLLLRTLDSFFTFNSFPLLQFILVEDGPDILPEARAFPYPMDVELIATGERVGQIAAIDYAYSRVRADYIFHLEDDWEFYAPNFIEQSLPVLEHHDSCLQVYIRALGDTNDHPVHRFVHRSSNVPWRKMRWGYRAFGAEWNGFSLNPGLRRMADYVSIGGYGIHCLRAEAAHAAGEAALSLLYRQRGMFAAILADRGGQGYVRHIGWHRTVDDPRHGPDVP
jgi:hypothetical protein